ncbi:MAG: adventurous gliding motility protein AgmC [Solirubrobacterales bacterium]
MRNSLSRTLVFVFAVLIATLAFSATAFGEADTFLNGDGHDGNPGPLAAGTTVPNAVAPVSGAVSAGATSLTIGTVRAGSGTGAVTFANSRLVIVYQSTGFSGSPTSGDQTTADITSQGVGKWEFARISTFASPTLNFTNPLINSYAAGSTQVIAVPEYSALTVSNAGRNINAQAWDGTSGGIVTFLVQGTLSFTAAGTVSANSLGYRGAVSYLNDTTSVLGCTQNNGNGTTNPAGMKGEGIYPSAFSTTTPAGNILYEGRGNYLNAGAGGDCFNASGGGGGNGGAGGKGGTTLAGYDGARDFGGLGGVGLTYNAYQQMVFGGGGGAGDRNNADPGTGGAGGGIVLVRGATLTGTANFQANGGAGVAGNAVSSPYDGSGGGGAGGTVLVRFQNGVACTGATANGGVGGNNGNNGSYTWSPAGGGGGGKVYVQGTSAGSCPGTASGGANGTTQGGAANGAVAGGAGATTSNTTGIVAPTGAVTAPTASQYLATATPTFSGTSTNNATIYVYVDNVYVGTTTANGSGNWSYVSASLTNAGHNVKIRPELAGISGATTSNVAFTVDTVTPTISVTSPANGATVNTATPTLTFSVTETNTGTTQCSIDSGAYAACSSGSAMASLSNASHTVAVRHTDLAGNVGTTTNTFTVDTVNPVVTISAPTASQYVATATPGVTFSVADATATTTQCSVDGGAYSACTSVFTTGSLSNAAHSVAVRATDAAGNQGTTTRNFTVDTVFPVVTISAPTAGANLNTATPTITFSVTETNTGTTTCSVDGGSFAACSSPFTTGTLTDGPHTVQVRHTDLAGNQTTSSRSFNTDTSLPAAPNITTPAGNITTSNATPAISGTAEANSTVTIYDGASSIGTTTADGSGNWSFTPGSALSNAAHVITARATDAATNQGPASASRTITVDTINPVVTISAPTASQYVATATPGVTFSVADATATTTQCSVDGGAYAACTSVFTTGTLTNAAHSVAVRATDAAGNQGTTTRNFTVDTTAPVVTVTAPANGSTVATANSTITFSVTETNQSATTCSIDGGAYSACTSGVTTTGSLADGPHSVAVRHVDLAGNSATTTNNFTVDTTNPVVTISSPTAAQYVATATPSVSFSVADATATTTQCSVDGGAYAACTTGFTTGTLTNAAHSVAVRATDAAGNQGTTTRNFTVDTVLPVVNISAPTASQVFGTNSTTISFSVTETNSGTTQCSFDGGAYSACSTGVSTGVLSDAVHDVTVRHTDLAGNIGSSTRSFTIDTTNPVVTISSPTNGQVVNTATPGISFSVADATTTTTQCSVDGGAYSACTSVFTTGSLTDAAHSVAVRATDQAGNQGTTTRNFTVDTTFPTVTILTPANGANLNTATPTVTFTVTDNNLGATTCSVDGGAYSACSSPWTTPSLTDGPHTLNVRHTDAAGNVATSSRSVTIDTSLPLAPNITTPSGSIYTTNTTPTISGTAEANSTVTIYDGVSSIGTTTADGSGNWTFTPGSALSQAAHSITARATDAANNQGPASAARSITVDTTTPVVNVTAPTAAQVFGTSSTTVSFSVTETNQGTTQCSFDGGTYNTCATGVSTGVLTDGGHNVTVRHTDLAGNVGSTTRAFTIDTTNPVVTISAPTAAQYVNTATPGVTFSVADATATTTQCSVDGGAYGACTSVFTPSTLSDAAHSVAVRATDAAGNQGTTTRNFTVDTTNPTVTITGPTAGANLNTATPSITFTVADTNLGTTTCSVDGGSFAACSSPFTTGTLTDGAHTVQVRHTDLAGNVTTQSRSFNTDTSLPAAPNITTPAGNITTNNATPAISGTAEANSTVTIYDGASSIGTTTADGSGNWSFTPGSALSDAAHVITARATDAATNQGPASASRTITIDTINPVVTISAPTASQYVASDTPSVTFSVADATATTTQCSVDGGAYAACTTGFTPSTLTDGPHSVAVRATDAAGNQGTTTRNFTVDTTFPTVTILTPASGESLNTSTPTVTFTVSDSNPGATTCSVDGGAFSACSSPFTTPTLTDGPHTVSVRHTDAAGNAATSARSFTVDTGAPAAPVITTPATNIVTSNTTPAISGTAEADTTVTVYDGAAPLGTTTADGSGNWSFTPGSALATGAHSITARATDSSNNQGPASSSRTITVDTTAPVVGISSPTSGQVFGTSSTTVSFGVTETNPGLSECSIDGGSYSTCSTGVSTGALGDGPHNVSVRHTDAAGNIGTASRGFVIDTTDPVVTISAPTAGQVVGSATPGISFSVSDATSTTTQCSVDGGSYGPCSSVFTTGTLTDGSHSVAVRATDQGGNQGTTSRSFVVDTTAPSVTIDSPADGAYVSDDTPTVTFTVTDDNPGTTECAVDGGAFAACSSPFTAPSLSDGPHTIAVRHTDEGGNVTTESITLNVDTTAPAAPAITSPATDITTSDTTPTVGGTAEANSTVTIYDGATAIGTTTADGSGDWTFTPGSPLSEGTHTFSATATDAAGNEGTSSNDRVITIDTTDPSVSITAPATDGSVTGDDTPDITFTATDSSSLTIECSVDGGSYVACSSPFTTPALTDGTHSVTVRATDDAGNTSSDTRSFVVDTTAPIVSITAPGSGDVISDDTPTVTFTVTEDNPGTTECSVDGGAFAPCSSPFTTPTLTDGPHTVTVRHTDEGGNASTDSRSFTVDTTAPNAPVITSPAADISTSDTTPTLSGTAEANSTVTIYDGATAIGTTTADGSGDWTFTPGSALSEGDHIFSATATDAAGNEGVHSNDRTITIDTTNPAAPAITSPSGDLTTSDTTPTISGTAEPSSTVTIYDDGTAIGTTTADGSGNWSFTPSTPLSEDDHPLTATAKDAAGNEGDPSTVHTVTIDTTAPNVAISAPTAGQHVNTDSPELDFTVTDANGPTSTCSIDGGSYSVCASGDTLGPLSDGSHSVSVRGTDDAGNTATASRSFVVDTTPPVTTLDETPDANDPSSDATFKFSSNESPSTFECRVDGGSWTLCTSPLTITGLADGPHTFDVRAIDEAGNPDPAPASFSWTIDTSAPAAPAITSPADPTTTSDNTPTFSGTAEANSTVVVYNGASALGSTTADGSGNWSFTPSSAMSDGAHAVTAKASDAAGNTSPASNTVNVTIDASAPQTSIDSHPASVTNDNTPSFTFSADESSTFECNLDSAGWNTCSSPLNMSALADGNHTFQVRAIDASNNTDATPASFSWKIDTDAPAAPVVTGPAEGSTTNDSTPHITGTAEANSTVNVLIDGSPVGTATANGSGNWSFDAPAALADGAHTVSASATDAAGNTGPTSSDTHFTVDTTPPGGTATQDPTTTGPGKSPVFDLATPDGTATITCSLDGGSFSTCSTPFAPQGLSFGHHTLTVHFTDPSGNQTVKVIDFDVVADATPIEPPTVPTCPVDEGDEPAVPANINVLSAQISRKTLLKFTVTSDQFIIARITVKNGSKKLGTAVRAINKGKRFFVLKVKKLPKGTQLTARLNAISLSGGKSVAQTGLNVDKTGKVTVGALNGQAGGSAGTSVTDCNKETGAPKLKLTVATKAKVKIGTNKLTVTATSTQFAVATFKVIQNGKVLGRKVYLLKPGKKLKRPLKLLGSSKLAKGKATVKVSIFSVDGVRVKTTKSVKVK